MHKAIALHRTLSATSNASSRPDANGATWTMGHSSNPNFRYPRIDYSPPVLSSHELAYRSYLRTGRYPAGHAFLPESATRFEDRGDQPETEEWEEEEDEVDELADDDDEPPPPRGYLQGSSQSVSDIDMLDAGTESPQSESRYSDHDASDTEESDYAHDDHRPRAVVSDVRSSNPSTTQDDSTREREREPTGNYTPNVHPSMPSVRILRAPSSFPSRSSGPGSNERHGTQHRQRSSNRIAPRRPEQRLTRSSAMRPVRQSTRRREPPPPPPPPPAKRRRNDPAASRSPAQKPEQTIRPRKGGNGGQSGFKRKEYKCYLCTNFYAGSKGDLKRHLESRLHKAPSYVCSVEPCLKVFTRDDALKRHMKNAHDYPPNDDENSAETFSKSGSPDCGEQ